MTTVTMKQLLEAGVHFGHQSRRWNPKMKPYIYTERNGIYIIDLKKTLRLLRDATRFVRDEVVAGKNVLFVGTKKQAKEIIAESASACQMHYVNNRWLGGLLTNFSTIRRSVLRLLELEAKFNDGSINQYVKKEQAALSRELASLRKNLDGIKHMDTLPDMIFIVDPSKEQIAITEARALGIPVIAVVDTNCNPDQVDWVIPGNDDAIRSIRLMCSAIQEAVLDGKATVSEGEFGAAEEQQQQGAEPGAPEGRPLSAEELEKRFAVYSPEGGGSANVGEPNTGAGDQTDVPSGGAPGAAEGGPREGNAILGLGEVNRSQGESV